MDETRRARLANRLREEIGTLLVRGEIKDHRVPTSAAVSFVKVGKDGSTAVVGISCYESDVSLERVVAGMISATPYIQGRIGRVIRLRVTPRLTFVPDSSVADAEQVLRTIESLGIAPTGDDESSSDPD